MDIQLRNFRAGDEQLLLDLSAAADEADKAERRMFKEELEEWLHIPGCSPETDFFIAEADGQPAGYAGFDVQVGTRDRHIAYCGGAVVPAMRRRGIGNRLMEAAMRRAAEAMSGLQPEMPYHFESFCRSTQPDVMALFEAARLERVRYFFTMQRPLAGELPEAPLPAGIEVRPYRPEHDEAVHAAFDDAFRDHWGHEPTTREDWQHLFSGVPHMRPELWMVAWEAGEIAGFSLNYIDPAYNEQIDRLEGKVGQVGVRTNWRRRGLATALLALSLRALRDAGMDCASLGVDAASPSNAVALYERVGFGVQWQNVVYRKVLE